MRALVAGISCQRHAATRAVGWCVPHGVRARPLAVAAAPVRDHDVDAGGADADAAALQVSSSCDTAADGVPACLQVRREGLPDLLLHPLWLRERCNSP